MASKDEKAERLKAALRANLRRRKAPAPDRGGADGEGEGEPAAPATDPS